MSTQIYAHKLQDETITLDVDMLSRLKTGETISTSAAAISVLSGTDPTASLMLSGVSTVAGTLVSQSIVGGFPGVIYMLELSIRTSQSNIYVNQVKIAVLSSNAASPP